MNPKLEQARQCYQEMSQCLIPPLRRPGADPRLFAIAASGTIIHHPWQDTIWRALNNALSCAYSAVQITSFQYGYDDRNREIRLWLATLPEQEQVCRREFEKQFRPILKAFNDDPLSDQRQIAEHRKGSAIARVRIECPDVCYIGSPTVPVPPAWMRSYFGDGDDAAVMAAICHPMPIEPKWTDFFFIKPERPMFAEVSRYLGHAEEAVKQGEAMATTVFNRTQRSIFPGLEL